MDPLISQTVIIMITSDDEQRPLNILPVEDNEDNRLLMKSYFKKTPHNVDIAGNGRIAVEKFKAGSYERPSCWTP